MEKYELSSDEVVYWSKVSGNRNRGDRIDGINQMYCRGLVLLETSGTRPRGTERDDGVVAQMVERLLCMQKVVGSIPSGSTNPRGLLAQLVRASS